MFRKLLSVEEAKRLLEQNLSPKPIGGEHTSLSEALNRVLAKDVVAQMDVPPFDRATADGYAVRTDDTFEADEDHPIVLRVCGRVHVGEPPSVSVESGSAAEIATGAVLPRGSNAVVMLEYTTRKNESVLVYEPVSKGENVMKAGSDIRKGEVVLRGGHVLSSQDIGVLAALGITTINVYAQPRVAILSTGAEIVEPGKTLPEGKIYDINTYTLSAAVEECGGIPINLGIVADEANQMREALNKALSLADVVVTSGGVSIGPTDIIPSVLGGLGQPGVIVCGITTRPGKPTTIAVINGKPVFSLPGHPTSSLLMFYLFVRPLIVAMTGKPVRTPMSVKAVTTTKMFPARGRRTFIMVSLARDESGRLLASPVPLGLSGAITTLAKADGFVEVHESQQFINMSEEVTVELFNPTKYVSVPAERSE